MCVFFKVLLNVLWRILVEYRMCVFGRVSVGYLGGYWVGIACVYLVRFHFVFHGGYCMYILGKVLLRVL
jgi:hypothetical protein